MNEELFYSDEDIKELVLSYISNDDHAFGALHDIAYNIANGQIEIKYENIRFIFNELLLRTENSIRQSGGKYLKNTLKEIKQKASILAHFKKSTEVSEELIPDYLNTYGKNLFKLSKLKHLLKFNKTLLENQENVRSTMDLLRLILLNKTIGEFEECQSLYIDRKLENPESFTNADKRNLNTAQRLTNLEIDLDIIFSQNLAQTKKHTL